MGQQQIERTVRYYATVAQKQALRKLTREGWAISGGTSGSTTIFLIRLDGPGSLHLHEDGSTTTGN